jgi:TonB family protein
MKQLIVTSLLLLAVCAVKAEEIQVCWLDDSLRIVSSRDSAAYSRCIEYDSVEQHYIVKDYWKTGQLYRAGSFKSLVPEVRDGQFIWLFTEGRPNKFGRYEMNQLLDWKVIDKKGKPVLSVVVTFNGPHGETLYEPFQVDRKPSFPGGEKALKAYISKQLVCPPVMSIEPIDGTVLVYFVVMEDGSLSDIKVVKKIHPDLDKEAVRVVQSMPRWEPGLVDGKPVAVPYVLPVRFVNKSAQFYIRNNAERATGLFTY